VGSLGKGARGFLGKELVGSLGEVWGWRIHATFVFVVEMPVYVCPHSSWWVA